MSEPHPCPLHDVCSGSAACGTTCQAPVLARLDLGEARARFEREATHGEYAARRYRMPYYVWGAGPPLVFVHGVSDSARSFVPVIARLAEHFRCVAYDLPDIRRHRTSLWGYTHEQLVEDLFGLLDHLDLPRAYVMGSSFGATVALPALAQRPERLPRAILQGGLVQRPLRGLALLLARLGRFLPGTMAGVPKREKVLAKVHGELFAERPPEAWRYYLDCTSRTSIATFAHQAMWVHRLDLREVLARVRQPVLLVSGDRDSVVPARHDKQLYEGLPNAGRAVIEGCGHLPTHTHPELLAEVVRRFLTPPVPVQG